MTGWPSALLAAVFCLSALRSFAYTGKLLSNSVTVTSSSVLTIQLGGGSITLVPEWAIQADSSIHWTNCFVSEKEINPWWEVDLNLQREIWNVRVLLLPYNTEANVPPDTNFEDGDLNNLTVYISNSSHTGGEQCGDHWSFNGSTTGHAASVLFHCSVYGRYVHVTVDAGAGVGKKSLGLCSVVINEQRGLDGPLHLSTASVTVSSTDAGRNGSLAIDGTVTSLADQCFSSTAEANPWLRIDLPRQYYVDGIQVLLYGSGGDEVYTVYVGRNLRHDVGGVVNVQCGTAAVATNGSFWHNVTCEWPQFTQHIYIDRNSSTAVTLEVCEVQVIVDSFLDIYHSATIFASSQEDISSPVWKAIDGSLQNSHVFGCYSSQPTTTDAYWTIELPALAIISNVTVLRLKDADTKTTMIGSTVRVSENKDTTSSYSCGNASSEDAEHMATCPDPQTGRYVSIVAGSTNQSQLSLCEVQVDGCYVSPLIVTVSSGNVTLYYNQSVHLSCSAVGCPSPSSIIWTDPQGVDVTEKVTTDGEKLSSTFSLGGANATGGKYMYNCTASNGNETRTIEVEVVIKVAAKLTTSPATNTYKRGSSVNLTCAAEGYPAPKICWEFRNETVSCQTTEQGDTKSESTIELTSLYPRQHGGMYTCKADNGHTDEVSFLVEFENEVAQEPKSQILDHGGSLNLSCEVTGYPVNKTVAWFKDGQSLDDQSTTITDTVNENRTAVVSTVILYNATQQTCGGYSCLSKFPAANVTLNSAVIVGPMSSHEDVDQHEDVTLLCHAVGCPLPVIVWQYRAQTTDEFSNSSGYSSSGLKMPDNVVNSTLEIKNISRSDTGYYRCCAKNYPDGIVHEDCSTEILIEVEFNVTFVSHPTPTVVIEEGQLLNLSCAVTANPFPTVTWLLKRKVCDLEQTVELNANRSVPENSVLTSFLELVVTRDDSGLYSCVAGHHQMSTPANVSVKGRPGTISPDNISVIPRNVGLVTVLWAPPCDYFSPITQFVVSYALASNGSEYTFVEHDSAIVGNKANISGLLPHRNYSVEIAAVNNIGRGSSIPVLFRSPPGQPSAPLNFSSNGTISPTSVFLSWIKPEVPNGDIQKYKVDYFRIKREWSVVEKRSVPRTEEFPGDKLSGFLEGLEPYTTYTLKLSAVNRIGSMDIVGNASNQLIVTTAEAAPSMPREVNVSRVQNEEDSLLVRWVAPLRQNGKIRFYLVYYSLSSLLFSLDAASRHNTSSPDTSTVIEGLYAFTSYQVVVRAFTVKDGNLSQLVNGTTDESTPSKPRELKVRNSLAYSVELSWLPPEFPRGVILAYRIDYSGRRMLITGEFRSHNNYTVIQGRSPVTNTTVGNLKSGFNYTFTVTAATVKGNGSRSASKEIQTVASEPVAPSQPHSLFQSETTVTVQLTRPNDENGDIDYVQLIVAEIPDGLTVKDVEFDSKSVGNYSADLEPGMPYIAAQWKYKNMGEPVQFVIGNGSIIGGFMNAPLKGNTEYGIVLKAITEVTAGPPLTSFSAPLSAATKSSSSSDDKGGVIAGVLVPLLVILVIVLVVILIIRRRKNQKSSYNGPVVYGNEHVDVALADFKKPSITACSSEVVAVAGNCALLEVEVTGDPRPKITWRYGGRDLPGTDGRLKVLSDGSLQIIGSGFGDSGMYRCLASSRLGSAQCQIKLRVEPSAEDIAMEHEPIPVAEFEEYVAEMHESLNEEFSAEYSFLAKQPNMLSSEASRLECNQGKNRYGNIFPYDHSRVVLATIEGVSGSDYINSSYLNGIDGPKGYIAAQGPNEQTTDDFWRMIWQDNVGTVVMLTNLEEKDRVKCHKYWPEVGWEYDSILVTLQHELSVAESITRCFLLTKRLADGSRQERTLYQFHFVDWPDHGIPDNSTAVLRFLRRVRAQYNQLNPRGPMVVHCSAGVGRTGTFVAIDYTIQKIMKDGEVDLFNLVNDMRQSRPAMVQTEAQYIFCHDAVLDYICCGHTEVQAGSLQAHIQELYKVDESVGVSGIRHQLQLLNKVSPPKASFRFSAALDQSNIYKNRYSDILAADEYRVNLDSASGRPAYINATFVDGYPRHNMYITTQGPVANTIPDFWCMVWEQDSDVIVMLTELHEDGTTMCARYWPSQGTGDYDMFSVILEHEKSYGDYVIRKLQVANKKESTVRTITQFHYTCWHNNHVPQSASSLIEIIGHVERAQLHAGSSPLIVVCNNGVGRSGTYCAISVIIDRLKTEQVVDVFQVVKAMRIHNPDYVTRLEDYQFCYNAAAEFLEAFDTYANFKSS